MTPTTVRLVSSSGWAFFDSISYREDDYQCVGTSTSICSGGVGCRHQRAGVDWIQVDEVVYAGGSVCSPGLDAALALHLHDDAVHHSLQAPSRAVGSAIRRRCLQGVRRSKRSRRRRDEGWHMVAHI